MTFPDHLNRAFLRSRCMGAFATIEDIGIPIDKPFYTAIRDNRETLQTALIDDLDRFSFYRERRFDMAAFTAYLDDRNIAWPRTEAGNPKLTKDTIKDMLLSHPEFTDFYDLRTSLKCLQDMKLVIGGDDRARASLRPYASKTSRCQPNGGFIFGWPRAWRRLIRPTSGRALAYIDVEQEEFAIAAVLSRDPAMMTSYESGDAYLGFAKAAGAAPPEATKKSHGVVRDRFKSLTLAVQYLMTEFGLGHRLNIHPLDAKKLIDLHRRVFHVYWAWSDAVLRHARMFGRIESCFGWSMQVSKERKERDGNGKMQRVGGVGDRTIRNWHMQTAGAEILRLAIQYALADGVMVCATIHDAMLIEGSIADMPVAKAKTIAAWQRAGREVLGGFNLRVDAKTFAHPGRFIDDKGDSLLLKTVQRVLLEQTGVLHGA
jgi:DNA polymerase-1